MLLLAMTALLAALVQHAAAQAAPSWSFPPSTIKRELV